MNTETHTTILPHFAYPVHFHWRSTVFAARYYGRTKRMIRRWCTNGRFAAFGMPVFQDSSHKWWIMFPNDLQEGPLLLTGNAVANLD